MAGSNEKLRVLRRIPEIRFDEELRGYNKHQVDRVLENLAPLADEVDVLVGRLSEAERRAAAAEARVMEGGGPAPVQQPEPEPTPAPVAPPSAENFDETLSKTLLLAQRTADATVEEAKGEAARIVAAAEAEAAATREAVEQEAASMRAAAADERSASIEQANREVAAMIDAARSTIDAKVAEAEAELAESHTSARNDLVEQIGSLQLARDALALDVEHFEGHLSSRREVIRTALAELNEVVEHPERLRSVMPPTPVADVPAEVSAEPSHIDVASLDTLATAVTADAEAQGVRSPDLQPSLDTDSESDSEVGEWAGEDNNTWADPDADPSSEEAADVEAVLPTDDDALSSGLLLDPLPADAISDDAIAAGDAPAVDTTYPVDAPTEAVPVVETDDQEATSDPFLDELRRATSEDEDDEALTKFLNEGEEENKGGWFGRRK